MKKIRELDIPLAEDARLVIKVYKVEKNDEEYPEKLRFALQYLLFKDDEWVQIARIDNYAHDTKRRGTHIHQLGKGDVKFEDMTPEEAQERIIGIGERIKKELLFGGKDGKN